MRGLQGTRQKSSRNFGIRLARTIQLFLDLNDLWAGLREINRLSTARERKHDESAERLEIGMRGG